MSAGAPGIAGVAGMGAKNHLSRAAETTMAFRLTTATAVAHGAWNIYILQPEWLREKRVFVTERPVRVETLRNGPGMRLTAGKRSPRWVATPFAVRVEFDKPTADENVGEPLAKLTDALPETPIDLVGYELVYRGTTVEDMAAVPKPLGGIEPPGEYGASLDLKHEGVMYHLFLSRPAAGDSARLLAMCVRPPEADRKIPDYRRCEAEARRIAAQYWQVTFL